MDIYGFHVNQYYIYSTVGSVVIFAALIILKKFLTNKLEKISHKTDSKIDDYLLIALQKTSKSFIFILSFYIGFYQIKFTKSSEILLNRLLVVIFAYQIGKWGSAVLKASIEDYFKAKNPNEIESERATIGLLTLTAKAIFFVTLLLFVLHNLGINVTALITGLGVGGIAIALAVQSILGDMIGSMTIIMDKPFVVGDYIVVDGLEGTVENVGLKTTRLRAVSGEQLIFSNADLLKSRIKNLKRMEQRRLNYTIGVTYETKRDQLEKIPTIIKEIVEAEENVRFDRCFFLSFGASSLDFEVIYWILGRDILIARTAQQSINLKILDAFNREGIEFAFPTQTLNIVQPKTQSFVDSGKYNRQDS